MNLARYGLAHEGWLIVLLLGAGVAWLGFGGWPVVALIPGLLLVIVLLKFRDPDRQVPADPLGVLSPVDGRVKGVEQEDDAWRIELSVDLFSPYVLRSPTEGKVLESGRELAGHGMRIRTDEDEEVYLRLHGLRWFPPHSNLDYGERVGQGQRYGILRGARRAELWLPPDAKVLVRRGDKVIAGESVVGRFHRDNVVERRTPA